MEKSCIIGCGAISSRHLEAIEALKGRTELVAVCDIKSERANSVAEKYGCAAYTDYIQMLEEVNPSVVHVCTPHYLHFEMSFHFLLNP